MITEFRLEIVEEKRKNKPSRRRVLVGRLGPGLAKITVSDEMLETIDVPGETVEAEAV